MTTPSSELINGICQQLLFSPKGGIEGVMLKVKRAVVQVAVRPNESAALQRNATPGKRLRVLAVADHSPKTADGEHAVYQFLSFADATGQAIEWAEADTANTTVKGIVASLHFARHGQPNGVMLETGEFIHLRPQGMALVGLGVGSKVSAVGELRLTVMGTRLLEAREVNRIVLD